MADLALTPDFAATEALMTEISGKFPPGVEAERGDAD